MTIISGKTYPVRSHIKELGFKWHNNSKTWQRPMPLTPDEEGKLSGLRGIIIAIDTDEGDNTTYIDTRTYKERFGRCEDAPCCGCCGNNYYYRNEDY